MAEKLYLRYATIDDSKLVFDLSNDETVRKNSINKEKIEWESHIKWFESKIKSQNCHYFVAFDKDNNFVGQIRFDEDSHNEWLVSLSVSNDFRNKGIGANLIKKAFFLSKLSTLKAYVKKGNIASEKLFFKTGFSLLCNIEIGLELYSVFKMHKQTYFIAEMSANHCGDIELAKKIIKSAKDCGADAIKIQTYTADSMTIDCNDECFKVSGGTLWDDKYLYNLYQEAYTPWHWQGELKKYADQIEIDFFSTPFDKTAVDLLETINVPIYKIASFEAIDIPLIEYTASKGKPMIISTGICSKDEIFEIIDACKRVGNNDITLLKCTSAYPAKPENMNLLTIKDMIDTLTPLGVKVGLSDHSMSVEACVVAVSLGAKVIEKHFTLDRAFGGADCQFSLNPQELKDTIDAIRLTEKLLGKVDYTVNNQNRKFARSLFVVEDIKKGEVFTEKNIRSIRPSNGCLPKYLPNILGKISKEDLKRGTPMNLDFVQ